MVSDRPKMLDIDESDKSLDGWLIMNMKYYKQHKARVFHQINRLIGLVCWVFTNDPGDLGSIPDRVIPKTLKMVGPAVRVFANGPGDLGSIPGRVIPKTLKMVLDTTLLNTQHYKVRFKGKVEQSWEWSSALPCTLV